jgi:hypothetical protein
MSGTTPIYNEVVRQQARARREATRLRKQRETEMAEVYDQPKAHDIDTCAFCQGIMNRARR